MSIRNVSVRVGKRLNLSEYQTDTEVVDVDIAMGRITHALIAFDRVKNRNPLQTGDDFTITGRVIHCTANGIFVDGKHMKKSDHWEIIRAVAEEQLCS